MFPDMNYEVDKKNITTQATGDSLQFDFAENKFVVSDGINKRARGIEAVKQWVELFLRTRPGAHPVYDGVNFGIDARQILNRRDLPDGFLRSEFERNIKDGLTLNPHIDYADRFTYKRAGSRILEIAFYIHTKSGDEAEVNIDV